jgi:phospholipase C
LAGLASLLLMSLLLALVGFPWNRHHAPKWSGKPLPDGTPAAIHKIRHVVIIMQENRSCLSYFGT